MALLLLQTIRYGPREGCKVACVPLLSDLPVILVTLAFAAFVARTKPALGILSLLGGAFMLYLAISSFRPVRLEMGNAEPPKSLLKGTMVNMLNPNPWLFWVSAGASNLAQAIKVGWLALAVFLGTFFFALVGSNLLIAIMAGRSREFLHGRVYRLVMAVIGLMLAAFAFVCIRQGIQYLR